VDGRFICGNPYCGANSFRIKQKLKNCMDYPYIYSEEELRCLVLNALIERDATVWNCKWKSCPDPIPVEGIPMWLIGEILFSIIPKFEKMRKPVK
jgi:hypothetical protein